MLLGLALALYFDAFFKVTGVVRHSMFLGMKVLILGMSAFIVAVLS